MAQTADRAPGAGARPRARARRAALVTVPVLAIAVALVAGLQFASHRPAAGEVSGSPPSARPFPGETGFTSTLDAGRYVTSDPFSVKVSVTVPAGWKGEVGGPYAVFLSTADGSGNDGPAVLTLVLSPAVYADSCQGQSPGSLSASVNDFVKAIGAIRGVSVTKPKEVTLGGLKGEQVTLTAPAHGINCVDDEALVMTLPLGHDFGLATGQTMSLTALDDRGQLLVLEEETTSDATAQDRAQLAAALESMSIGG